MSGFIPLDVVDLERDTAESVLVTLQPRSGEPVGFVHGQYLTFRRTFDGVELRRSYSICSPEGDPRLRVGIRRVDGGAFSTWATSALAVGDQLEALPPAGTFTHPLDPTQARRYLLVAGGSGITPVYSIAASILAAEPHADVTLLQVDRGPSSAMLLDDVEGLRNRHLDRFRVWRQFTQERSALDLLTGRPTVDSINVAINQNLLPADPDLVFVCGPEGLIQVMEDVFRGRGLAGDAIRSERFSGAQTGRARQQVTGPVDASMVAVSSGSATLHGRSVAFEVYEGDSLLAAIRRVHPDVPYSCEAGVCSTCRAHLVTGDVTMKATHGLLPGEIDAGFVLTCQSQPTTRSVVVDFDV
jgi:ring-1,2-phenylacetyl-CoA epoxidase subunit PaaE